MKSNLKNKKVSKKKRLLYINNEGTNIVFAYKEYNYLTTLVLPLLLISVILTGSLIMMKLKWSIIVFLMFVLYVFILLPLYSIKDILNKRIEKWILKRAIPITDNEVQRNYTRKPQNGSMTNSNRILTILYTDNSKKTIHVEKINQVADVLVLKVNI